MIKSMDLNNDGVIDEFEVKQAAEKAYCAHLQLEKSYHFKKKEKQDHFDDN